MRLLTKSVPILLATALVGCTDPQPRDHFASTGITYGTPSAMGSGEYRIPIEFETEVVHSARRIDSVDAEVSGSDILITAKSALVSDKPGYPGHVEVKGAVPGTYTLKYRDPDGTDHTLGPVTLP